MVAFFEVNVYWRWLEEAMLLSIELIVEDVKIKGITMTINNKCKLRQDKEIWWYVLFVRRFTGKRLRLM